MFPLLPGDFDRFVEQVVPILQRAGAMKRAIRRVRCGKWACGRPITALPASRRQPTRRLDRRRSTFSGLSKLRHAQLSRLFAPRQQSGIGLPGHRAETTDKLRVAALPILRIADQPAAAPIANRPGFALSFAGR